MGFGGRSFLLAQFEMLVMLYLHGAGLQGFPNVTDWHCPLSGVSWIHVLEQVQKWIESGLTPADLKSLRLLGSELTQL